MFDCIYRDEVKQKIKERMRCLDDVRILNKGDAETLKQIERFKKVLNQICCDIDDIRTADVQPVNQWISVEDRPPNHYEEVLVVSKLENIVYFAWYDADISMFMGHSHMWTTREVTHWMPLPDPPVDGGNEDENT